MAVIKSTVSEGQSLKKTFRGLVADWKTRKSHSSCVEDMAMDPSYQQIIGLGPDAVPLLLAELERDPDHWFWALFAITRADPVPPASRGKVVKMAEAWLKWGKRMGYR